MPEFTVDFRRKMEHTAEVDIKARDEQHANEIAGEIEDRLNRSATEGPSDDVTTPSGTFGLSWDLDFDEYENDGAVEV